jgi:putative transposase
VLELLQNEQTLAEIAKQTIKNHIIKVFEQIPIYGEKKVRQQLLEDRYKISLNTVAHYRQELGL